MPKFETYQYKHGDQVINLNIPVDNKLEQNKKDLIACLEEAIKDLKGEASPV